MKKNMKYGKSKPKPDPESRVESPESRVRNPESIMLVAAKPMVFALR